MNIELKRLYDKMLNDKYNCWDVCSCIKIGRNVHVIFVRHSLNLYQTIILTPSLETKE